MGTCTYGSGADMGKPAIGIWYGALCRAYTSHRNMVWRPVSSLHRRNSDTRYFIELRPIGKSGQMGAGIPVTYEFMNTLLESYTEEMSGIPAGRIPENMLACNPRKGQEEYIWYNPPGKRQMFFHKDLNIQDGIFNLPGIIYHVKNGSMDVFAFKGKRPVETTPLFRAPFFNVTGSSVCLGSSSLEKPHWEEM